jgi:tRNA (guanine-N7-)-methyltransferase
MSIDSPPGGTRRAVRSFVLRAGRTTVAQRRALEELWPHYGVGFAPQPLDLDALFGRRAARTLEIGIGNGETLVELAARDPAGDYLGIEVHEPGIGHCLLRIAELGLGNVRLIRHDAVEVLREQLPAASLERVLLLFPDPWPKKRHHKRRIVNPDFLRLVAACLTPGGVFHVATDWAPYAEHIRQIVAAEPRFEPLPAGSPARSPTRFERRGERLGHEVFEASWRRSTAHPG